MSAGEIIVEARRRDLVWFAGLVIVMLCLNGFMVRVAEHWTGAATGSILGGVSPFELLVMAVALPLVTASGTDAPFRPGWREVLAALAMLVPSSAVSWAALALYAGGLAWRSTGERRSGALLFLALALASLWSSVGLKLLSVPVTHFEAGVLAHALSLLRDDIVRVGNVVGSPEGYSLVLMTACTSLDALPRAITALAALAIFSGAPLGRNLAVGASILTLLFFVINTLRLGTMAWSAEAYAFMHGPVGANLFDLAQTALVVVIALFLGRESRS